MATARAATAFVDSRVDYPALVRCELRGSLSATSLGHAPDRAVILGMVGGIVLDVPLDVPLYEEPMEAASMAELMGGTRTDGKRCGDCPRT